MKKHIFIILLSFYIVSFFLVNVSLAGSKEIGFIPINIFRNCSIREPARILKGFPSLYYNEVNSALWKIGVYQDKNQYYTYFIYDIDERITNKVTQFILFLSEESRLDLIKFLSKAKEWAIKSINNDIDVDKEIGLITRNLSNDGFATRVTFVSRSNMGGREVLLKWSLYSNHGLDFEYLMLMYSNGKDTHLVDKLLRYFEKIPAVGKEMKNTDEMFN